MTDPLPVGLALFAFAVALFGVRFVGVGESTVAAGPTTVALDYAILVAAIAETLAGTIAVIRGNGYKAYIVSIFGIWLIGFFLLAVIGSENEAFTPDAFAWYILLLLVPVAILAVPAFVQRNVALSIAFVGLVVMLLFAGLAFHNVHESILSAEAAKATPDFGAAVNMLKISAWAAFVVAAAVWWIFAREVYELTGLIGGEHTAAPEQRGAAAGPGAPVGAS